MGANSWARVVFLGFMVSACGARSAEHSNRAARPSGTPLQQATAYEHGAGVARDYHAAAEIYRAACEQGRGQVSACGALLRA